MSWGLLRPKTFQAGTRVRDCDCACIQRQPYCLTQPNSSFTITRPGLLKGTGHVPITYHHTKYPICLLLFITPCWPWIRAFVPTTPDGSRGVVESRFPIGRPRQLAPPLYHHNSIIPLVVPPRVWCLVFLVLVSAVWLHPTVTTAYIMNPPSRPCLLCESLCDRLYLLSVTTSPYYSSSPVIPTPHLAYPSVAY